MASSFIYWLKVAFGPFSKPTSQLFRPRGEKAWLFLAKYMPVLQSSRFYSGAFQEPPRGPLAAAADNKKPIPGLSGDGF
jgi:hypothetical protein